MMKSLSISASGMQAQQNQVDTIANNMANVNTTAYKKGVAHFEDMLYQTFARPGSQSTVSDLPAGIQMGTGVRLASSSKYFGQGSLEQSSSDLALAIEGVGFLQIQLPDGTTSYTRDGNLHMDSTGKVVTGDGFTVLGFPTIDPLANDITIAPDGTVSYTVSGQTTQAGQIQLARFANPEGLSYQGYNRYLQTEASGAAQLGNPAANGYGYIAQHYLENSNVNIVEEMVDLIAAERAYELNSKCAKASDDMLRIITTLR